MSANVTLDQLVISRIHEYPSLYGGNTYEDAKMRVLDHFLNVIGNGIRDSRELEAELADVNLALTLEDVEAATSGEQMYYAYREVKDYGHFCVGEGDSEVIFERDRESSPHIKHWLAITQRPHNLYPNFKAEYSTVYQCENFRTLDKSFTRGAIDFYRYALKWLAENESSYHHAFPQKTEAETQRVLESYEKSISRYETHEEVSEAFGREFHGDVYRFASEGWQEEKVRIIAFINKTIQTLESWL